MFGPGASADWRPILPPVNVVDMNVGQLCGHFWYQSVFFRYRFNQIRQSQVIPAACFLADHITRLFCAFIGAAVA